MMCLAPLLLLGYALTLTQPGYHPPEQNGVMVEAQTCEVGLGAHVKGVSSGMYGAGLHYGLGGSQGVWSATVQPSAGLSYVDHPVAYLPMRTQFEIGVALILGYEAHRVAVGWWHLSNAGLEMPNPGVNLLAISIGHTF